MVSLAYYKVFCKTHCSLILTDNSSECLFIFPIWNPRGLWKHRTARATCFVVLFIWGAEWHFIQKSQLLTKDTCISICVFWDLQPLVRDRHTMRNTHNKHCEKAKAAECQRGGWTKWECNVTSISSWQTFANSFWFPHLDNGYIIPIFCEDRVKSDSKYLTNAGSPSLSSHPHWGRPCDMKLSTLNYLDICKRDKNGYY